MATRPTFRPQFDCLEQRALLATAANPVQLVGNYDFMNTTTVPTTTLTSVFKDGTGNLVIQGSSQGDRVGVNDVTIGGKTYIEIRCKVVDAKGKQLKLEIYRTQASSFTGNVVTPNGRIIFLGGAGDDSFHAYKTAAMKFHIIASGGAGKDELWGGWNSDILDGGADSDQLNGEAGDDFILGGDGDDTKLNGGTGNDLILGGAGKDTIHGDWGSLNNYAESCNDRIEGGQDGHYDKITLDTPAKRGADLWVLDYGPMSGMYGQTDRDNPGMRLYAEDDRGVEYRMSDLFFTEVQVRKSFGTGWFTTFGEEFTYLGW